MELNGRHKNHKKHFQNILKNTLWGKENEQTEKIAFGKSMRHKNGKYLIDGTHTLNEFLSFCLLVSP